MGGRLRNLFKRGLNKASRVVWPLLSSEATPYEAINGRLPDFLGIGVQKGGTTTLQRLLGQHPRVFLQIVKVIHYFTNNYARGEAWYREKFASSAPQQLCGEITPYYSIPSLPSVFELVPRAKIVVLLRIL